VPWNREEEFGIPKMANPIFPNEKPVRSLSEFDFLHNPSDKNSKLGVGSFASVKLAKDKKTGKQHAIKMISMHPTKMTSSDLHNIKTEISIHRKLEHPNIVKFYDYIQKDHHVYLVLDYAEGGNLYSYIHKKKNLSADEIFRFFYQTCLAFQYLHQNDVLHRDLKPENLLLDKDRNIKLCDFGWAARKINEKRLTFCGTYEYMAPEIVYKKHYDYRVDIWSLGVLLYELIHREAPYKGRSLPEISKSLSKTQITFSSSINPQAKDLILKILKTNPSERLSIAQILSHPWVQSHLSPEEADDSLVIEEYKVSPKENKPARFQSLYGESPKIKGSRREHEHFKSEILCSVDSKLFDEVSEPQTRKNSNTALFSSFNAPSSSSLKEKKEKLSIASTTGGNTSTHSEMMRRSPLQEFCFNRSVKMVTENPLSARNRNKSSCTTPTLPEKINMDDIKYPSDIYNKKKIFESSILSPNFRTKVDSIMHQLSSHTTTHRAAETISPVYTSKAFRLNQLQSAQTPSREVPIGFNIYSEQHLKNKMLVKASMSDKTIDYSSANSYRANGLTTQVKSSFSKKISLQGDLISPMSTRNLTTRAKFDTKSPEAIDQEFVSLNKYGNMENIRPFVQKNSENGLSIADPNKYRVQRQESDPTGSKVYKGLDYKRKQGFKVNEDNSSSNLHISSLSGRRNENKENKKDLLKENQMRFREENAAKYAF